MQCWGGAGAWDELVEGPAASPRGELDGAGRREQAASAAPRLPVRPRPEGVVVCQK